MKKQNRVRWKRLIQKPKVKEEQNRESLLKKLKKKLNNLCLLIVTAGSYLTSQETSLKPKYLNKHLQATRIQLIQRKIRILLILSYGLN